MRWLATLLLILCALAGQGRDQSLLAFCAASTASTWTPASLSPLAWYKADGDATDASGNGYNGSWRGAASYVSGVNGQAFAFGASQSAVTSLVGTVLNVTNGTICAWVKPNWNNADGLSHFFWDTYGGSNNRFVLYKGADAVTAILTQSANRGGAALSWTSNVWTFITCVWGVNTLATNNVAAFNASDGGLFVSSPVFYLGDRYTTANNALNGAMDDVLIFNRVLTAEEITAVFNWRQ